jgi:dipeptidyl aminopeptidase/acylaminoacyl peptidase
MFTRSLNPQRLIRLAAFALLAIALAYLVIQTGLAWVYAYVLTHPLCSGDPPQPAEGPLPHQEVTLETRAGLELVAWYYPPQNGAVLVALGGSCGALGGNLPPVDFLLEQGFGILQIDSRAQARPRAAVTLGGHEVLDVEAALDFLEGQPEVSRVGAYGFSMGGVGAIRAAARHPEIEAVVAEGGFYNLGEDFVEPESPKSPLQSLFLHTIALAYWANSGIDPWEISPIDDLAAISPRPLMLIYGEAEAASGHAQAQYDAAIPPKEFWLVPGGAHGRNHLVAPEEYQRRVLAFFSDNLLDDQ